MSETAEPLHRQDGEGSVVDQETMDVAAGAQGGAHPVGEDLSRGGETAAGPMSPTRLGGSTSSDDDEPGKPSST